MDLPAALVLQAPLVLPVVPAVVLVPDLPVALMPQVPLVLLVTLVPLLTSVFLLL